MRLVSFYTSLFLIALLLFACQPDEPVETKRVVIGIASDIESLNPMYSFSADEGAITELLFLNLAGTKWNKEKGENIYTPMLAESWEWNEDSTSITFNLRDDVYWSDSTKCTSEDVVFSFDVYSDPAAQTRFYGIFNNLYMNEEGRIDLEKTFEIESPTTLKINFAKKSTSMFEDLLVPVLPSHILSGLERENIFTDGFNSKPVTNGPFYLSSWDKTQSITLKRNPQSFLYDEGNLDELIFKVVPEYNSRIIQLKKNEIDITEFVQPGDVNDLKDDGLQIYPIKGREYDYVGWMNIDAESYSENGTIKPHKLFGNKNVRTALTYAINRQEILNEFLNSYGEIAVGPVSSIFKSFLNTDLKARDYDPVKAKKILEDEGWKDSNRDGTIDKNGTEFSFNLDIAADNSLREYAATVIKNNLQQVGVKVEVRTNEFGNFVNSLFEKKLDAWIGGWTVPVPPEFNDFWHSNLETTRFNFPAFASSKVDSLLEATDDVSKQEELTEIYKEIQKIIYDEQPVTFLYWIDNIVAANKKIENVNVTPLGAYHNCWEWKID